MAGRLSRDGRAQYRVRARPAMMSSHQPHGSRHGACEANVTAVVTAAAGTSRDQRPAAAVSATASVGQT
jgi:hypothetical protein